MIVLNSFFARLTILFSDGMTEGNERDAVAQGSAELEGMMERKKCADVLHWCLRFSVCLGGSTTMVHETQYEDRVMLQIIT